MRINIRKIFFTPIGAAILVISLVMLVRALVARNAYEIVLSFAVLLLLLFLGLVGFRASRKLAELKPGWKPPYPFTARAGESSIISGLDAKVPLFFRLHFAVKGQYVSFASLAHSALKFFSETSVSRNESTAKLEMDFPMSGVFQGEGVCKLRDVFGFFSFTCGEPLHRTINIRPSPCYGKDFYINAQSGAEDRRNKHSTDDERYYMREYTPGDRFRDINWKSSEKIDTLITRISPDNQEKVSRLEVYFRNYGNTKKPSLEELWLLDRAKARLSNFLRSLKEQQPSFIFDIRMAGGASSGGTENREIEDEESLDSFLEELAGIGFAASQNETATSEPSGAKTGELYVFSTACDNGLLSFLSGCMPRPVSLFFIAQKRSQTSGSGAEDAKECEILYKRDFLLKGIIPHPGWLIHNKIQPMGVQSNKTEIIYAETKL